jgi:hypothetical protein
MGWLHFSSKIQHAIDFIVLFSWDVHENLYQLHGNLIAPKLVFSSILFYDDLRTRIDYNESDIFE